MTETMNSNPGQPEAAPNPAPAQGPVDMQKDIEENKLIAVLSYLGILFLIPLLAKKDSPYAQFHAKQGMVLFILSLFLVIPFLNFLIGIVFLILWIIGIINVLSGKMAELPLIGQFAKKFNF